MTPELWQGVEELFHAALARPANERQSFLDDACQGNTVLRSEITSLLAALEEPEAFSELAASQLAQQWTGADSAGANPVPFPERLGPYRLLEVLGEGGMSTVYLAEQSEPLPRRVALKLMRWGGVHDGALRRFELEREVLARMSHPTIAQVFGAGATEHGQPYVVLEYIPGPPITDYCKARRLGVKQRLRLFVAVCDGVRHAHEKALIHRDLKPSNILVSEAQGDPLPKIIDFGIAKSLEPWSDSAAQMTISQMRIGSPGYMSPEAVAVGGRGMDTRSDVYSLGIVLCQLLVGARPFETPPGLLFPGPAQGEAVDPPSPSQRLGALPPDERREIASQRRISESKLIHQLRGELDWIVLRAIAHEPAARYGSVAELAADIERWLTGRPVEARPPSFVYRARKAVQRHAVAFTAAGLMLATIVGFSVRSNILYLRATAARVQAEELVNFMLDDLSAHLEPMGRLDLLESVSRQSLAYFESAIGGSLDQAGHRPTTALRQIGRVLASRGDLDAALQAYERGRAIDQRRWQAHPADPSPRLDLATDLELLGRVHGDRGELGLADARLGQAETHLRKLVEDFPDHVPARLALAKALGNTIARLRRLQGRTAQALALSEEALAILQDLLGARPDDIDISYALGELQYTLGMLMLYSLGDAETAVRELEAGTAVFRNLAARQPEASIWRYRLAVLQGQGLVTAYSDLERLPEAQTANREALAILDVLVREEPSNSKWAHGLGWELIREGNLALEIGDLARAVRALQRSVEVQRALVARTTGPHLAWLDGLATAYEGLAEVQSRRGEVAEALSAAEAALATQRQIVGQDVKEAFHQLSLASSCVMVGELRGQHGDIAGAREALAETSVILGQIDEADVEGSFLQELLTQIEQRLDVSSRSLGSTGRH